MSIILHKVPGDHRGQLVAIEGDNIQFNNKRVLYIHDIQKKVSRGSYSHYGAK
jgi:hypothetical protein